MRFAGWWSPPVFRDASIAEQGSIAYAILRAGTVACVLLIASAALAGDEALLLGTHYTLLLALHAGHLWLLRRGFVRVAVRSFCLCYFALITSTIVEFGGIHSAAGFVYPPLVLLAGVTWSSRAAIGFAIAGSVVGTGLVVLDHMGLLRAEPLSAERVWAVMTAVLFVTAVTLHVALAALRKARDEALALQTRLDQAERLEALGRLAGGVAHDFNNQLTAVLAHTALLRRAHEGTRRASIEAIELAAQHAAELTRQLLEFGRQRVLEPSVIDVRPALIGLRNLLGQALGPRIALHTQLDEGPFEVRIDRTALERVLVNLILNARDAMPEGGEVVLGARRVRPVDGSQDEIEISVQDHGIGMDEATRAHIFEPFFTTKARGKGTGLGLSSVLGVVEQSGGRIDVDSAPGRGTRFGILLPATTAARPAQRASEHNARNPSGIRMLLVEDQDSIRRALRRVLIDAGYDVTTAGTLREALALAAACKRQFELLVTDVVLPDGDGIQLLRLLREQAPGLAAIVVSGYMRGELAAALPNDANTQLVHKPFTPDELLRRLEQLLTRRPTAAAPEHAALS